MMHAPVRSGGTPGYGLVELLVTLTLVIGVLAVIAYALHIGSQSSARGAEAALQHVPPLRPAQQVRPGSAAGNGVTTLAETTVVARKTR